MSEKLEAAIAKRLAASGPNVAITYTKGADAAASIVKEIESANRGDDQQRIISSGRKEGVL